MDLEKKWEEFKKSNKESKTQSFLNYCLENIKENDLGNITIRQASYNICAACMNIKEGDTSKINSFEEIQNISCDLELPDEHRSKSLDEWEDLKKIIKSL